MMKFFRRVFYGALAITLLSVMGAGLFYACAALPPPAPDASGETARATSETEAAPPKAALIPADDGLDSPWFRGLPPEARAYLGHVAAAFRENDGEFLASQGETQYERDLRSRYDEETYLALLYRLGPYSEETPVSLPALPRLECAVVAGIQFTDWAEEGPLLRVSARLFPKNGPPVPCTIMLLWRLEEIKILGFYP